MKKSGIAWFGSELRIFWLSLLFVLVTVIIGFLNLPLFWAAVNALLLLSLMAIVMANALQVGGANAASRAERYQLESIVKNLKDGVIAYDQSFKILVFNKAAEEICGVKSDEVLGQAFTLKIKEQMRSHYRILLTILFPALAPVVIRRTEPGVYPQIADFSFAEPPLELRVYTHQIIDEDGQLAGFIKVIRDRTRELTLLRSKSEFLTIASHQLRTPLTGVSWAWENLKTEPLTETQTQLVQTGMDATKQLIRIVEDMLDVAKIEEGRFGYEFRELNLVELIEEIVGEASLLARKQQINVYLERPKYTEYRIRGDAAKLGTALGNLIDNGIKYNVPGGKVVVQISETPNQPYVQVSVKDTGAGIPEEDAKKLFTKFFRGENVKKFQVNGSGLGLYIVKNIVRRHGGKIWAESTPGRGSTFHFTLPTDPNLIPPKETVYEEE